MSFAGLDKPHAQTRSLEIRIREWGLVGERCGGEGKRKNKSKIKARENVARCDVIPAAKIHISGFSQSSERNDLNDCIS